jgi:hypothetical protein
MNAENQLNQGKISLILYKYLEVNISEKKIDVISAMKRAIFRKTVEKTEEGNYFHI